MGATSLCLHPTIPPSQQALGRERRREGRKKGGREEGPQQQWFVPRQHLWTCSLSKSWKLLSPVAGLRVGAGPGR